MKELASEVYTGMAAYGKVRTIIGTVTGTLVGVAMLVGGTVLLKRKSRLSDTIGATITNDPYCVQYHDQNLQKWKCKNIQLSYRVNDKDYVLNTNSDSTIKYTKGLPLSIYYDPSNPANSSLVSDNTKIIGWILVVIGILLLVSSWVWLFLVLKFKIAAASSGASGIIGTVRGAFK